MLGIVLLAWATTLPSPGSRFPQGAGTIDAPVYENASFGVSIPRPFHDWVFEPGAGRRTTTVIFHPHASPLREQLWGALVLTALPGRVPLGQVADQRVQAAWRPQLGPTFALLSRDSLTVAGFPSVHVVMTGVIGGVALDAEEYVIARSGDLIVLQFRYPRGLPRDSAAAGYRRVLDGLRIRGGRAVTGPPPELAVLAESLATPHELPWSPWQARAYDALVRYDPAGRRADFAVRVELVNDGPVPADSVTVWLWPAFPLDSVRIGTARLPASTAGSVSRFQLPGPVQPQVSAAATFYYHLAADSAPGPLPPAQVGLAAGGAYFASDWLPRVQPMVDSAGQAVQTVRASFALHFDVPGSWRAAAPGRLTSEAAALGRRRLTWTTDQGMAATPAFALGPYRSLRRRSAAVVATLWLTPSDTLSPPALDSLAASVQAGWAFCSRAFGRLPVGEVEAVATDLPASRGFAGLVLLPRTPPSRDEIVREVARSWWGNAVAPAGAGSGWVLEGFPAWAAIAARGALDGDTVRQRLVREAEAAWHTALSGGSDTPLAAVPLRSRQAVLLASKGAAALEAARRAAGEASFREAILTIALEHRGGWITLEDILAALGPDAQAVLRTFLF
jgi:hypothetical protein